MAHKVPIEVPGPFVVFQGIAGDGLWNTIDSLPILLEEDEEEFQHVESEGVLQVEEEEEDEPQQQQQPLARSPLSTFDPMLAQTNMPPLSLNPLTTSTRSTAMAARTTTIAQRTAHDETSSFIVVPEEQQQNRTRAEERALESWHLSCRSREERQRHDFLGASQQRDDWWQSEGRLAVFTELPRKDGELVVRTIKATLSPGSTVVAQTLIRLDPDTLQECRDDTDAGCVELLKLESPYEGYVVLSTGGYYFLGPGFTSSFTEPQTWLWRVTCQAGAFVRQGLELNAQHVATLPYGSLLKVTGKTVNRMGLSRLRVCAMLDDDVIEGWISEFLNPLSGQRGPIALPVPFPVPAMMKVEAEEGVDIRSDVELASSPLGHAPKGALLSIVGRAFSEHPEHECVQRFKLAGNGGWVSVYAAEEKQSNFDMVGSDGNFDPDDPGTFHLEAQVDVQQQVHHSEAAHHHYHYHTDTNELSSIDDDEEEGGRDSSASSVSISIARSGVVSSQRTARFGGDDRKCLVCTVADRNSTIVHGETGHIACCLVCARMVKAQGKPCPICRLPIDSVIQHFWS